jgi:lipopolysaccharide transport system ATP-binding protein
MGNNIIRAENISKRFVISHETKARYNSLGESVGEYAKRLLRKGKQTATTEEFWALKDVNFEINTGDRVGIIGRNGAGKSTLLKVLSRITEPTTGRIQMNGRVASLLEVGTGFHPELTGRENIFLNGAILGMSRVEIKSKFDEIVAFAEVEQFLDTPVKRYSSGMYVRLAFAVAAHLEPEILIVDEVLAVGDAEFQKKCLGKMQDLSSGNNRTVIFVSHNMAAIKSLCTNTFVLDKGTIKFVGEPTHAVTYYLKGGADLHNKRLFDNSYDKEKFTLYEISLNPKGGTSEHSLDEYQEIELNSIIKVKKDFDRIHLTYVVSSETGEPLFTISHLGAGKNLVNGYNHVKCSFPKGFLNIGTYYISFYLIEDKKQALFFEQDIISFCVQEGERLGGWMGREPGFIKPIFEWTIN